MVYSLKYTKIFKKQIENVKIKNKVLMKELMPFGHRENIYKLMLFSFEEGRNE
jgi:hypothetical protein